MQETGYLNKERLPWVLGLGIQEAIRRLQAAGAVVACVEYSSKKGVFDADDLRVIRMRTQETDHQLLKVDLIMAPSRIAVREPMDARK